MASASCPSAPLCLCPKERKPRSNDNADRSQYGDFS